MPPRVQTGQLIRRDPRRVVSDGVTPQLVEQFATECGLHGTLRLVVCNGATGDVEKFNVDEPFVLVGRASNCQVRLNHPDVNFRHAYLQVIQGRMYCYDLDSDHGIRWGSRRKKEGVLTIRDVLHIGPFSIRLSQSAAYGPAVNSSDMEWELQNDPLAGTALRFMNASGRTSRSPLRPMRASITLLGRSGRCHHKLSDTSVSQVHCSIVRTEEGFWVVDLLGRDGTSVNGRSVKFSKFEDGDELTLGRFRMQMCEIANDQDSVLAQGPILTTTTSTTDHEPQRQIAATIDDGDVIPISPQPAVPAAQNQANFHAPVVGKVHGISENMLMAMMEQFSHMQQQLLVHTQQQMTMMAQMFSGLYQGQQASIVEQLNQIHTITAELNQLRSGNIALPGVNAAGAAPGVSQAAAQVAGFAPPAVSPPPAEVTASPADTSATPPGLTDPPEPIGATEPVEEFTPDSGLPLDESDDVQDAGRSDAGGHASKAASHEWITQRINDLERERSGRWRRLMQLISGGKDLN